MSHISSIISEPKNELVRTYAPKSIERLSLEKKLQEMKAGYTKIPMIINGKDVFSEEVITLHPPHEHKHILGEYSVSGKKHIEDAIHASQQAKASWIEMSWESKANIFLKAAELISQEYRDVMNASTMLGQSKNVLQAEIDSACELIDFLRFNVYFLNTIYNQQPISTTDTRNVLEYRPLEGFVVAITPFNFTAIGGNLPTAPAMCGNTVIWKPSRAQIYSAYHFMRILQKAGLPDGVINLIYPSGTELGEVAIKHPHFSGLHFTGSTQVFNTLWQITSANISHYANYPRIVGETGGKDFILAHPSADIDEVVTGIARGAFEYQGQKCSAASRVYLPSNLSQAIIDKLVSEVKKMKMGIVEDFSNFINAVIDKKAFDKIFSYIEEAKNDKSCKILVGGNAKDTEGYFIEPTVIETTDPTYKTMCEEIFGPVVTVYVYDEKDFDNILEKINTTSGYALTGSIFSQDRKAVEKSLKALRYAAGNFYINDKPTGAVVGQQPFGGARKSGTNDKAGSALNLYRWLSPRTIKENYVSPKNWRYPFLG